MTIIDRPAPARHRATAPTRTPDPAPAPERSGSTPLGGRYVTTTSPRTASEGSYVTRWSSDTGSGSSTSVTTRGTYVTTTVPPAPSGGHYTYTG